ncbi:MAG: carbamoyl-phosphate synthase (glutamine-hydrolyzing) [Candidatus Tectimicrobiota bacterium]|nr:MAG: carbamoyl-phosphate synthase (glutamine-hydrolyzing) [Candidatus Tectomicrobia bacterium]
MTALPRKVLVLGSAALKIGEAGEFDYSGTQAIKALKDEGVACVLVNPNIATIQTSERLADEVYFLPVTPDFVAQVIARERPDGLLLSFGGQTALNCGVALDERGVLARYGVQVLGTPVAAIRDTEDRARFAARLAEIGVPTPRSHAVSSVAAAVEAAAELGYPVMLRAAYALGGLGAGVCTHEAEVRERAARALAHSPQLLVEEYLAGWKEIEYEVVRDRFDNCITVCNMENIDPMGIHTGESAVVAPSQTLSNAEYHQLREAALRVVRYLGIIGECNIQFALDPHSGAFRAIEVNARLSRSSALASKATGYPLAYVAAKLALGYSLPALPNAVTGATTACFEPALDYVVVKLPRWDLKKFRHANKRLGSGMKSVGEVMAIGRCFEEALQKALRMLNIRVQGLVGNAHLRFADLDAALGQPTPERLFAIAEALRRGYAVAKIHELSHIDPWFLYRIRTLVEMEQQLRQAPPHALPHDLLKRAKQLGFADAQIAALTGTTEAAVRRQRQAYGLRPCVKQIDTLAAEYPAQTNYLYLTYNGEEDDVAGSAQPPVLVLGSGPYCIGSSVEFDWCGVTTVHTLRQLGYPTVVVNCNPETVSTDYNESDRLYFEELSLEALLEIAAKERPLGLVLCMGGQIPNTLALACHAAGLPVLGTAPEDIDRAEDRHKFAQLLETLGIAQPPWRQLQSLAAAQAFAQQVGYPVLVRPSYVLSGAAMSVACNDAELARVVQVAAHVSPQHPVVVSKFIEAAQELEFDAVARHGELVVWAISEHVEHAGVHSGDATLVFPPRHTAPAVQRQIRRAGAAIARALRIHGPFNVQFLVKDGQVQVIECNLRASRSFPFVSKVSKVNFIELATRVLMEQAVRPPRRRLHALPYVGVKAPQFSFTRLEGVDPTPGVEMASTGEVACLGEDFDEAFLKALLAVGYRLPLRRVLLSTGPLPSKAAFLPSAAQLVALGVTLYATPGTARFLRDHGIAVQALAWPLEAGQPNVRDVLRPEVLDLVVNIPKNNQEDELTNDYFIRRRAADLGIPLITNLQLAQRLVAALSRKRFADLHVKPWRAYGGH